MQSLCNDLFHSDSHCFQDSSLVIFSYSVPWQFAMWGIGYNSVAKAIEASANEGQKFTIRIKTFTKTMIVILFSVLKFIFSVF